jgi:hypothetical protein
MTDTNYVVGEIYEIDAHIKIDFGRGPQPHRFYAKLIGFNSDNEPVFERGKEYICWSDEHATITVVKKELAA